MKKSIQSYLEQILYLLNNPNPESLKMSLADVHSEGIFSLVIAVSMFVWTQRAQEALLFTSREEAESIIKTFEVGRLYTIVEIIK